MDPSAGRLAGTVALITGWGAAGWRPAATKDAIESLTRALASEVGAHGVTVNAVAPGGIATDMGRDPSGGWVSG